MGNKKECIAQSSPGLPHSCLALRLVLIHWFVHWFDSVLVVVWYFDVD